MASKTTDDNVYDAVINLHVKLDGQLDLAALQQLFDRSLLKYRNFSRVPTQTKPGGAISWITVHYDPINHFHRHTVGDKAELRHLADQLMNKTMDLRSPNKPWWDVHLIVEHGNKANSWLHIRVHHVVGDGISLTEAFADIMTDAQGKPVDLSDNFNPARFRPKRRSFFGQIAGFVRATLKLPLTLFDAARNGVEGLGLLVGRYDTVTPYWNHKEVDAIAITSWPAPLRPSQYRNWLVLLRAMKLYFAIIGL